MFESDDFDYVLSQFDFPEVASANLNEKENINTQTDNLKNNSHSDTLEPLPCKDSELIPAVLPSSNTSIKSGTLSYKHSPKCPGDIQKMTDKTREGNQGQNTKLDTHELPKHTKRKIIRSYFDHQSKRKFPGPAGMLTGAIEIPKDDGICQMELLSQDMDYTQNNIQRDLFESPIWNRLQCDIDSWKLDIDSVKTIKQQALSGNLRKRKAQNVTAFVEAVDRSVIDPMIKLRDATGSIECTLHRDAWSTFSQYIVSDCCALILQKPTVLTTRGAFKKHYLNITLSNILAIYSSTILSEEDSRTLPDGYTIVCQDELSVIKTEKCSDSLGTSLEQSNGAEDLDGLDSFFSDDVF